MFLSEDCWGELFGLKFTKFNFGWGSAPKPTGSFLSSSDSLTMKRGKRARKREVGVREGGIVRIGEQE